MLRRCCEYADFGRCAEILADAGYVVVAPGQVAKVRRLAYVVGARLAWGVLRGDDVTSLLASLEECDLLVETQSVERR